MLLSRSTHMAVPVAHPGASLAGEEGPVHRVHLHLALDKWGEKQSHPLVTTQLLGKAKIPELAYEQADGSPYRIGADYFGKDRNAANPFPGPFELPGGGKQILKVWPLAAAR